MTSAATALSDALAAHEPRDDAEAYSLGRIRRLLDWLPAPFDEYADPTHVTGSAIVRDAAGRVLLHRHKRLGIWLQPGGHLEPGEPPWDAAVRETREETGARAVHPRRGPVLLHVDVHEGPRGHVHLDLRYHLEADGQAALRPDPGESTELGWHDPASAAAVADRSLVAAIAASDARLDVRTAAGGAPPRRAGDRGRPRPSRSPVPPRARGPVA